MLLGSSATAVAALLSAEAESQSIAAAGPRGALLITDMLSFLVLEVREYVDAAGRSPFTKWLRALNVQAAAKAATALERLACGNLSNVKAVGSGVLEYKIDFGPGYRIYFGRDGDRLVILLAGGTKKRQRQDIRNAQANWQDYRQRKA